MNGALETLISQTVGASDGAGAETKAIAAIYLNRGRMIIFLVFLPLIWALLKIDVILVALG